MLRPTYRLALHPTPSTLASLLAVLCAALSIGCSDDGGGDGGGGGGGGGSVFNRNDGGTTGVVNSKAVDADDYCARVCKVADDCDDDFDKQTCSHRCDNQASSIVKLNPQSQADLYACFDDSACKIVNADDFISSCLSEAIEDLSVTKAGKDFCAELEAAANDCDFEDYDEDTCERATTAFADDVLLDAKVCAGKMCDLVVECLEATFTLPGEVDGTAVGLDTDGKVASGSNALPAVAALLPETAGSEPLSPVNPVAPDDDPDASVAPVSPDTTEDEETTDGPVDTSDEPTDSTAEPTDSTFPTDTTDEPTDSTETSSSEPAPTDTSNSSEPAPTSEDPTDSTDTTDSTEPTDTTDPVDPEACDSCRFNECYYEVQACALDPEGEDTGLYTCAELDSAVLECNQLYGSPGQESQWDDCYYAATANTSDVTFGLFADYANCYAAARDGVCFEVCQ